MAKHLVSQRYVFKIHTSRLRRSKWNLQLTISQARENKELISLSESQCMRFIDELNNIENPEFHISDIKNQIRKLKFEKNLSISRPKIRKLYDELDQYQFKKDYVCVVIDTNSDYRRIFKHGFKINGVKYKRLLGTTGGVKNSTIVFVSEHLVKDLKFKMDNGRDLTKKFVPAKLEAYYALICSSSTPVSKPNGVVVVHDCITTFHEDVIELDDTGLEQPSMKYIKDKEIRLDESDGYGLAMPQLMERWGYELNLNYLIPGAVIRNSFCKGAVFPVDFQKFARERGITKIVDVWGNEHNICDVELVLTESMLKLWDSYKSIDDYLENCEKNHYSFAITKTSEEELENERTSNYQFIQSYEFSDEQIDELIEPTISTIRDILSCDYRKTILYTKGVGLNEYNVQKLDGSWATALMIEPNLINDQFVRSQLYSMIKRRIDDAKVGVLSMPANYSLVSGDPYSLCQSMLGLEVTGLLKAGEIYSKYWIDKGVDKIATFRAPMTSHHNIRLLKVTHNDKMDEFYQYMTTPTIFNSWDTCADALNGMDKDGDAVINTSFKPLVENTRKLPAIVCVQRNAKKVIPTEEILMESNINSFGNAVGGTTNNITSMFEVQSRFDKNSREYRILDYRIKCGQLYQQNAIDKTKGIDAKPMPNKWTSWIANKTSKAKDSKEKKENWFNRKIVVDKKPYFMQYVYPTEKTNLNDYKKKNEEKCLMRFRVTLSELMNKNQEDLTKEQKKFIQCYYDRIPVGMGRCVVNRICWKIEDMFDGFNMSPCDSFDYNILKSDESYSKEVYSKIKKIYEKYKRETAEYAQTAKKERISKEDRVMQRYVMKDMFRRACVSECPNEYILCNIVLDLCYQKSKNSKQFAWDVCGDTFIKNLLAKKNYIVSYPTHDDQGDIEFNGMRFKMAEIRIKVDIDVEEDTCQLY